MTKTYQKGSGWTPVKSSETQKRPNDFYLRATGETLLPSRVSSCMIEGLKKPIA